MDEVSIHVDELIVEGDGREEISPVAEQVMRMVPGPYARQIAASVDQAIGSAIRLSIT
jgi:hypothetical protein